MAAIASECGGFGCICVCACGILGSGLEKVRAQQTGTYFVVSWQLITKFSVFAVRIDAIIVAVAVVVVVMCFVGQHNSRTLT